MSTDRKGLGSGMFAGFSWADTPKLGVGDVFAMLWSERLAAAITGGMVCLLGLSLALMAPRTYGAHAELLVRLGPEYVYQPNAGANGAGAGQAPDMQSVINSELRMLSSDTLSARVINAIGMAKLYPAIANSGGSPALRMAAAQRLFAQNLKLETAPETPTIALSFKNENAELAAEALNRLVDEYLSYRRDILVGGESDALSHQSQDLDQRSADANAALSAFLSTNGIADFDAEMTALAARATDAETQSYDAAAKRGEALARAQALRARYNSEPAEIELYSESDARKALVDLQVEREQLLTHYQDDAPPVREIDRRINQINAFLAGGDPASTTRRGPNPVRQEIQRDLVEAEAEARAQAGRQTALAEQRAEVQTRLETLHALEPEYRQLLRQRTILEQNAGNFAARAEEARSRSQLLGRSSDNISPVERAVAPAQGQSLRTPIAIITLILAAIAALSVGLGRALLARSFPTPASAARTLGTQVLAVTPHAGERPEKRQKPANDAKARPNGRRIAMRGTP
jgi:uncharacterized protein involved in exopolysaccharide biosynthesis